MNSTIYIFGNFSRGYDQFPDDYTRSIFNVFKQNAKAKTQICIHRRDSLMYYGYIRSLENESFIGLCLEINGHYLTKPKELFSVFESVIETMVRNGSLIHYDDHGEITTSTPLLSESREEMEEVKRTLDNLFNKLEFKDLPSVSFSNSSTSVNTFSLEDNEQDVTTSSYSSGYTFIYKSKNYNTNAMNGYKGVIYRLNKQIQNEKDNAEKLQKSLNNIRVALAAEKRKRRNTKWVSILALIVLVLGVVIWNKVLFPDEVTKYNAGAYLYYGPMKNGKPNGVGVAIYPKNDTDKRLYYYGNFTDGERVDSKAIMFYRDGSYFRGSMNNDNWHKGVFYNINNEHFVGVFRNNKPYTGTWYNHIPVQKINDGVYE